MKREDVAIIIAIVVALVVDFFIFTNFQHKKEVDMVEDENELYTEAFDDICLKFERYEYVLGQNMIVGVEKSVDGCKTYRQVTSNYVVVSNESKFKFMNENQAFIISRELLSRDYDFRGLKVSNDGGVTFTDATFEFVHDKVDVLNVMGFPYFEDNKLKLECSIYEPGADGYHEVILTFISEDNGLSWHM